MRVRRSAEEGRSERNTQLETSLKERKNLIGAGSKVKRKRRTAHALILVLITLAIVVAPTQVFGQQTGHGIVAEGTIKIDGVIANGWLNRTYSFTSKDLLRVYGVLTIYRYENGPFESNEPQSFSRSAQVSLYLIREDESPPLSQGTTVSSSVDAANAYIYPQFTYKKWCFFTCWYEQSDPINFAYEFKSLNDVISFLKNNKGWYEPSWPCAGEQHINDFSGYGWKANDRTLRYGDCYGSSTFHLRFFVMANGRIVVGAHQEANTWCCGHQVTSWGICGVGALS